MSNSPRIVVIHTSPATVDLFARMLRATLPHARVSNMLDDSILPELRDNGGDIAAIAPRWESYARTARALGADLILNACSSIGELCAPVARTLGIPVVRVDAELARVAVRTGKRIGVVATLRSTLRPTCDLLQATARAAGLDSIVQVNLAEGAYEALMAGNQDAHDERVLAALRTSVATCDVVVLAQASMARVLPRLAQSEQDKCLVSPPFAVADVDRVVQSI
jgi:Asp/Glu/hydantoin racemase